MSEITYHAEYVGNIDGEWVARMYRAYNEKGAPYVIGFDTGDFLLTLIQAPTEFIDGEPDEDLDRQNAIDWVHALTELVEKARAYDAIADAVHEPHEAFVVDELTDIDADSEWVDSDGDHYKHINGEWHIAEDHGDGPWRPVSKAYPLDDVLENYGPYTAVSE